MRPTLLPSYVRDLLLLQGLGLDAPGISLNELTKEEVLNQEQVARDHYRFRVTGRVDGTVAPWP